MTNITGRERRMQFSDMLFGPRTETRLPERVAAAIRVQEQSSEILICVVQICAIVLFAALYALSPKGFTADAAFAPVPWALSAYAAFTFLRLFLAVRGRLTSWFLGMSVVVDIAVLMLTIWSFHLQYDQPPSIYLKAPTLLYVFIIIGMRALRFDPRWVLLAGLTAIVGWLVLLVYAVWGQPMSTMLTRNFADYATSSKLLVGAEVDKIVSILMVTLLLALALERARRMLIRAVVEGTAAAELSRFFAPDIAATIVGAPERLEPGTGVTRDAAVMFIDLRGFTTLASMIEPARLISLLGEYHAAVLPVVQRHRGSVITYLGDGIMITFGATRQVATCAADAVRAAEDLIETLDAWAERRQMAGMPPLRAGIGVTFGPVVCGAIGTEGRLEFATVGDAVNRAARLQGLTKAEQVPALVAADAWEAALSQGLQPRHAFEQRMCTIAGIGEPSAVVALM